MNNPTIAILITSFLRNNLLYKCIQSIIDNYNNSSIILIADQGYADSTKDITIDYFASQVPLKYYKLSFDCGLGYAHNYLVQKASEMQILYCLIMPDSIQFTETYNFEQLFNKIDSNIIVNFELKKVEPIPLKNIFLAKTDILINLWDEEMKIYEYRLAFAKCFKNNYEIAWNNNYNFKKIKSRSSEEYQTYCKRIKDFKKLSDQKMRDLCI